MALADHRVVYMGSAIFFGLTCPANADGLINGESRALRSPMTVAIQNAGWQGGVHLINSFIFVTCLSAVNSSIYVRSRPRPSQFVAQALIPHHRLAAVPSSSWRKPAKRRGSWATQTHAAFRSSPSC